MKSSLAMCAARFVGVCVLIGAPLVFGGCARPPGTVSGTVTFKGKPLTHGQVVFYTQQDNGVFTKDIESDGHYKITNITAGPAKVAVISEPEVQVVVGGMNAGKMGSTQVGRLKGDAALKGSSDSHKSPMEGGSSQKKKTSSSGVTLPEHYKDPERSGLSYTVKSGSHNHYDIDLVDK
jgi:hypothetical protein